MAWGLGFRDYMSSKFTLEGFWSCLKMPESLLRIVRIVHELWKGYWEFQLVMCQKGSHNDICIALAGIWRVIAFQNIPAVDFPAGDFQALQLRDMPRRANVGIQQKNTCCEGTLTEMTIPKP